jgi:hypothetical protein
MIAGLACTSQFIVILDASVVNIAYPRSTGNSAFTSTGLPSVGGGCLLALAGFMLLSGRAEQRGLLSRRKGPDDRRSSLAALSDTAWSC